MDLFEELESYEEKTARQAAQAERPQVQKSDGVKRILAKEPQIRGSPRRLNIIASLLVGKSYPQLKQILPPLRNTGARSAERAIENARRRAHLKWDVPDENRLVVEQAWVGKGEMQPRLKIHARGKTGIMHRRWGKMWVQMRYISVEDDEQTFIKTCEALKKEKVPTHKVRFLLRYGPRTTVFRVSKAAGLTRQQGRSYLKYLTNTRPEFRRLPFTPRSEANVDAKQ
jgi:ribosomal protein L22